MEHSYKNLRDMGGLVCSDGRRIKSGMIFRSPVLNTESETDIAYLESLGLDEIIDFRSTEEIKERPDPEIKVCRYIAAPVFDGRKYKYIVVTNAAKVRCLFLRGKRIDRLKQNKLDSYEEMPFSPAFGRIFEAMDKGKRFIFHCTEGKDRTGIAAMLIELVLGRNENEILSEYLLSNELRPNKNREWLKYLGCPRRLIDDIAYCESTHEELMNLAKNAVLKKYTNFDEYLEKEFGVTEARREKWREIYLERE